MKLVLMLRCHAVVLTNPKFKSKLDLGFSLETHFPTTHPLPGKVDRVQFLRFVPILGCMHYYIMVYGLLNYLAYAIILGSMHHIVKV